MADPVTTDESSGAAVADEIVLPVPLEVVSARVGSLVWLHRRAFESLGARVQPTPEPSWKLLWSEQAAHHAGWAEQWSVFLPTASNLSPDDAVAPASAGLADWWERWFGAVDADRVGRDLAVWARVVLPALVIGLRAHGDHHAPATDRGIRRLLRMATLDLVEDWIVAQTALAEVPDPVFAEVAVAEVELRGAGGLLTPLGEDQRQRLST